jgi:3'-phosphoadenosine 5'-phosphosulfate sulfotransferase (PAPS reductase)/FAD synthetase
MQALAFSGGKDSMACLHLLKDELDCAIYVDTGFTYPETREMVNYAAGLVPMYVVQTDRQANNAAFGIPADVVPVEWTVTGQAFTDTKLVTIQSALQCCFDNLAKPLLAKAKALGVTHLVYGQRQEEAYKAPSHHGEIIEGMTRLHPIEDWTTEQVFAYLKTKMTIPPHYALSRSSLDCYDCPAYRRVSKDLVAWTKARYPERYAAYQVRAALVNHAIADALEIS